MVLVLILKDFVSRIHRNKNREKTSSVQRDVMKTPKIGNTGLPRVSDQLGYHAQSLVTTILSSNHFTSTSVLSLNFHLSNQLQNVANQIPNNHFLAQESKHHEGTQLSIIFPLLCDLEIRIRRSFQWRKSVSMERKLKEDCNGGRMIYMH